LQLSFDKISSIVAVSLVIFPFDVVMNVNEFSRVEITCAITVVQRLLVQNVHESILP